MTTEDLITEPALVPVVDAARQARQQSLTIIEFLNQHHTDAPPTSDDTLLELSKEQKLQNAHLAQLRGLNRKAVMGVRGTKQETTEARQEIDTLHLQLQNLYYEQQHLNGDITSCEAHDHKYTELPLISPADFIAKYPQHAHSSDHDVMLARIEDELKERKALEAQRQAMVAQQEAFAKERASETDELGKLDTEVEKFVASSEAVQKVFDALGKMVVEPLAAI